MVRVMAVDGVVKVSSVVMGSIVGRERVHGMLRDGDYDDGHGEDCNGRLRLAIATHWIMRVGEVGEYR